MIQVNGKKYDFQEGLNVRECLRIHGFEDDRIAVEKNGVVMRKSSLGETLVEDGDVYEVVSFVGGG